MSNTKLQKVSKDFVVKRYADIQPFGYNDVVEVVINNSYFGDSIVDDSHYRPSPNVVRVAVDSGKVFQEGVYDFDDGKDNGYTPALRSLAPDRVEVDEAVEAIKQAARKSKADSEASAKAQAEAERAEKISKGLETLGDIASTESTSQE